MSVVSSVGCTVESAESRRRRESVADSRVGCLVIPGMAAPKAVAVLEAVRQLRRPGRPVHARVERHAELALAQQRIILVNADVAADAACMASTSRTSPGSSCVVHRIFPAIDTTTIDVIAKDSQKTILNWHN